MDSDVRLQPEIIDPASPSKSSSVPSSDESDIENDLVSTITTTTSNSDPEDDSFLRRYFSNHSTSLLSRMAINSRRLSQCREEDEDEDRKEVPSSDLPAIMGSDKSLSESSSGSKTSVIDTVTGPTHKFVITKTKTTSESDSVQEPPTPKKLSEAARIFASRKQYRQANTVGAVPSKDVKRPTADSLFRSPLQSPHMDSKFFDTSLIDIKNLNSSTSTVDYSGSAEDIWVKRIDPDLVKKVS